MPSTRDLLQRFRPAAAPGAATATGVPADLRDERAAELAAVFAALGPTVAESEQVRRAAVAEAQQRRDRAGMEATARLAQASLDAEVLRTQAVAEAREKIASSAHQRRTEAEQRAREIEHEAALRLPQDVEAVVAAVRSLALGALRAEIAP